MFKADFVRLAMKQKGKRYIFGTEVRMTDPDPKAFDCSEMIEWLFHRAGAPIADGSVNQFTACKPFSGTPQTGDLFFLKNAKGVVHHVGLCLGGGVTIEAKGRLFGVVMGTVDGANKRGAIWRRYPKLKLQTAPIKTVYVKPTTPAKPATAAAPKPVAAVKKARVTADVLHVRATPHKTASVVANLKKGDVVVVGANYGGFLRIQKPVGFASAKYLEVL